MARSDESALVALGLEYSDAVRARDVERWTATWTEDAHWELGPDRHVVGRDAIVELWSSSLARYAHVVQLYLTASYDIDTGADTATGRCELYELCRLADGSSRVMAGHYVDDYRRTPDGWRFSSRRLRIYYQGPPDLTGTFRT